MIYIPLSKAQKRASKKYFSQHWTQIKLSLPNAEAVALRQYCTEHGYSVAGFIRGLIKREIGYNAPLSSSDVPAVSSAGVDVVQIVQDTPRGDTAGS